MSITDSSVKIQTSSQSVPVPPSWFGEVTLITHFLKRQGVLVRIVDRVRFARRRFGRYELIDFVAVLLGYAISGERTLEAFYERVLPFAPAFMALFERSQLPTRSTLSRFLAALDQGAVEALRELFLEDLCARPLTSEKPGGVWDRQATHWLVFDVDGTRQAARQRALPRTSDRPPAQRRFDAVCAPGYLGRKRGEVVRTRTAVLQAHTHQWLGTFGGAGNGDYRGELLLAVKAISAYMRTQLVPLCQAIVRLDGHYGNGAIVTDLAGLAYVMRGKDDHLLNLPAVQARLTLPPDQQTIHPESGSERSLFDCPDLLISAAGQRSRVIVATHQALATPSPIGVTREGVVYELFFTALPQVAFTAADVVGLYLHRGAFETVLSDEDQEQDPDRWCSRTACGQEAWQIVSQWIWNLRLELGHQLHPTPMRLTEFAEARTSPEPELPSPAPLPLYGPPIFATSWKRERMEGCDFTPQADGTLCCPAAQTLYAQERRPERDGTLRVLYTAKIGSCRPCPLRSQCQWQGTATKKPRRVSVILHPLGAASSPQAPPRTSPALAPLLWGDWSRRFHRRECLRLLRDQRVDVPEAMPGPTASAVEASPLSRASRAHWRLSWAQRLARNARASTASEVSIKLFGVPTAFAAFLGLLAA